jgi:hypothetical protein
MDGTSEYGFDSEEAARAWLAGTEKTPDKIGSMGREDPELTAAKARISKSLAAATATKQGTEKPTTSEPDLSTLLTKRIARLSKRGEGSESIAKDMQTLKDVLATGNPDEIKQVVSDLGLRFSKTGKPIFVKDGRRVDLYTDAKAGKAAGEQLKQILATNGVDVDAISFKKSAGQYPPTTAFEFTRDDGTTVSVIEATPVQLTRPKLDASGNPLLGADKKPIRVPVVDSKGEPVLVRHIIDPSTDPPKVIDVETPEGRTRALEVLRELQKQTQPKIAEALDSDKNAKQFFGNIGEIAVLEKLLSADMPAYALQGSAAKSDILVYKKDQQTGSEVLVYYSVKSTTNTSETVEAGGLGANALPDLQHSVSGSTISMTTEDGEKECSAATAMKAAMDVHGALIRYGVGKIDCNNPDYEGSKQAGVLKKTPITAATITSASNELNRSTDVCYKAFVARGIDALPKDDAGNPTDNLGNLSEFTTKQFANILRETGNSVKASPADIGAVVIDPTQPTGIKAVKFTCHSEIDKLLEDKVKKEYKGQEERQLKELLGLRLSTRCVGTSLSRIINTTHPLKLTKANRAALQSVEPYANGTC